MTHDANFSGDRLRLVAYLLVVENGMPERPSRFKRRIHALAEQSQASDPTTPCQTAPLPSLSEAYNGMSITNDAATNPSDLTNLNLEIVIADNVNILETNASKAETVTQDPDYDISRSPTPAGLCLSPVINGNDTYDTQALNHEHSDLLLVNKYCQKARTPYTFHASKASRKSRGSSNTRKRRLPLSGLALLRTTTWDDLPQPCDADTAFVGPISDLDPIEDSQVSVLTKPAERRVKRLQGKGAKQQSAVPPQMTQTPKTSNIHPVRSMRSPTQICQTLATLGNIKQQPQLGFQTAFDGFVGSELDIKSKKRPDRQGKTAPSKRPKVAVTSGLALTNGPLPGPTAENIEASTALTHLDIQESDRMHIKIRSIQHIAATSQDLSPRSQSVVDRARAKENRLQQREKVIYNQLSSITAPVRRRNFESSEAEAAT